MKKNILILALFSLLAPLFASNASSETSRYVKLYERIFSKAEHEKLRKGAEPLWLADVAAKLAKVTKKAEYGQKSIAILDANLPELLSVQGDFHVQRALGLLVLDLKDLGLSKAAHDQVLKSFARMTWDNFLQKNKGEDHNIALAEALSCAAFVNYFKNDPSMDSAPIQKFLAKYWSLIKETGDLDEDATNYTSLGIIHCIELARMLGHEDDLVSPGFRRMFERLRNVVSPSGLLPEWGDSYFDTKRTYLDFLLLCEYAAVIYNDPTFLTVARRLYDPEFLVLAQPDSWGRGISLFDMNLSTSQPLPLPLSSMVDYRVNRISAKPVVDKLILRTGTQPGDAMVFMDLYASGSHCHPNKGPSVAYYEVDGVPLYHNLGRHGVKSAIAANNFWALDAKLPFPGVWKPGEWFTMTIPKDYMLHIQSDQLKIGAGLFLRNFPRTGTRELWFDNLRLEGKAGIKMIDGFEDKKQWSDNLFDAPGIKIESSSDRSEGNASQCVNWGVLKGLGYTRNLAEMSNLTFSPDEFDKIRIDLKYTGIRPYFHFRQLCEQIDVGDQMLPYTLASARADQKGKDAYGEAMYSRYIIARAKLERRLVLTTEGCLIVHDRWTTVDPGASMNAGQLWQLYAIIESGPDWFCSDDDGVYKIPDGNGGMKSVSRRMVVKFASNNETKTFVEKIDQPCHIPNPKGRPMDKFFTVGSKRLVRAGEEAAFTMVVVPNDPDIDPGKIASAIKFKDRKNGVDVEVKLPNTRKPIRVSISKDSSWKVVRK